MILGRISDAGARDQRFGRQAVFVDRDGVVNANRADHVLNWEQFAFLPGALKALAMLARARIPVIVVTNQAAIARGQIKPAVLDDIHARMSQAVLTAGGSVLDVLYCPHDAKADCACRKPKPGLLLRAAKMYDIELEQSYYVGDALTDVAAGMAAGCRCVLVDTGRGRTQQLREEARFLRDYHQATDLLAAAKWICSQSLSSSSRRPRSIAT